MAAVLPLKEIFAEALRRADPSERAAYLAAVCTDAQARERVEALLRASEDPASFLDAQPALPPLAAQMPTGSVHLSDQPPERTTDFHPADAVGSLVAGRYKLLEQIGEGGMGTVWMAEQREPVKRLVALKLIKPGMDTQQVLARFEAERQALALMDHPNIAKVLDGGTSERGRPYFVMELVKGVPLTQYCDARRLTIRQRLELFAPICSAVQHAHQKGIIHRDLKPSNVLITEHDGQPIPKVIDFGLAKALNAANRLTNHTLHTAYGTVVGTPLYMAPEQVGINALDVDTRTDIYSLGVMLYELLTGTTPLEKKRVKEALWDEVQRLIREEEPPRPSARLSSSVDTLPSIAAQRDVEPARLSKLIRGELDWIVMKALEKDRNRRYETANGLARDIQRYLADELVEARPPSFRYRLGKFVRKHRGPVLAAVVIVLLLVGGILGTSAGFIRAERLRWLATERETQALDEKARAQASQEQAIDALRATTDEVVEHLIGARPVLGPVERTFMEHALQRWQRFAAEKGDDQAARSIRAEGIFRVARIQHQLGKTAEALVGYRQAIALHEKLSADYPATPQLRQDLATAHDAVGVLLFDMGQYAEAEAEFRQGIGTQEKLASEFPAVTPYRKNLARMDTNLANALSYRGEKAEAEAAYRRALGLFGQGTGEFDTAPNYRRWLASTHEALGALLLDLRKGGQWDVMDAHKGREAEAELREALDIKEKLATDFPAVPDYRADLAQSYNHWGNMLLSLGKPLEAEATLRRSSTLLRQLAVDFPGMPRYREALAGNLHDLGQKFRALAKGTEAEAAFREGTAVAQKLADDFPDVVSYRIVLGTCQAGFGLYFGEQPTQMLEWCTKAIKNLDTSPRQVKVDAKAQGHLRIAHWGRALALERLSRHAEATADWDRAVELSPPSLRPELRIHQAVFRAQSGQVESAIREAMELADNADAGTLALYNAACIFALAARPEQPHASLSKEDCAQRAVALLRRVVARGHTDVEQIKKDDDLKALRQRDDFKQLLAEMEKGARRS